MATVMMPDRRNGSRPTTSPNGNGQGIGHGLAEQLDHRLPSVSAVDAASVLRPQTLQQLRTLARTQGLSEYPVNLSHDEVRGLLDLIETHPAMASAWNVTLLWALRYTRIVQRMAEQSGYPDFARWLERNRIEPMEAAWEQLQEMGVAPLTPEFREAR